MENVETTMESMYIFASILHPGSSPGFILRAYDREGTTTMIHVEDPSYTIAIPLDAYKEKQSWIDSHSAVHVSQVKRSGYGANALHVDMEMVILELHSFTAYKMLHHSLVHRGVPIIPDRWIVDNGKSASLVSNIGLPSLCSWYAIDTQHAVADTKRGDALPKVFTKSEMSNTSRFLHIHKRYILPLESVPKNTHPLKTAYFSLHTTRTTSTLGYGKRKKESGFTALEERFHKERQHWKDCPVTIGGIFYGSSSSDEIVDQAVIISDGVTHILTLSPSSDVLGWDSCEHTPCNDEGHLLCTISKVMMGINADVIIVHDINDVSKLKTRFEILHLNREYSQIFTKHSKCPVTVTDVDSLRCNHLISCNISLSNLYQKTGGDMKRVQALKQKLKTKTSQHPYVLGFGVAVLSARQWSDVRGMDYESPLTICRAMQVSNQVHHHVENFQYQIHIAGTGFVSYNGGVSYVRPSEIYNLNVGRELMDSRMAVLPGEYKNKTPLQGGLVLDPQPCYTFDPVVTLDFDSMYASIIETFNYCCTTLTDVTDEHTYATLVEGIYCVSPRTREGVLPKILKDWKQMRSKAREHRTMAKDFDGRSMYATREKAIKACIVSMIGLNMCGSEDVPFTDGLLGNIVTKTGRHLLQELQRIVHNVHHPALKGSPKVIAGDTDSCFVRLELDIPHTMDMDILDMWKRRVDVTKVVVGAIKDAVHRDIALVVKTWTNKSIESKLNVKWEGSSFCSIHFPLKKRYIHWETDNNFFQVKTKGVTSIQSTAIPIEADLESKALDIAVCGWYLCMRKGTMYDYPDVLSPSTLMKDTENILSVYMPGQGWLKNIAIDRVDGEGSVFQVFLTNANKVWTRTFYKDENGPEVCIDFLRGENDEKKVRCSQVVELVKTKITMIKEGAFSLKELLQRKSFRGYDEDGDRYCKIAATVGRTRSRFGLQSPTLCEEVEYVHVNHLQKTRYNWHRSLVANKYVDPILALREGLYIDAGWYMSRLLDLMIQRDSSLIAVMINDTIGCGTGDLVDIRQEMKSLVSGVGSVKQCVRRPPLGSLPRGVTTLTIPLHNLQHTFHRKGDCLLGSLLEENTQSVTHYYVREELTYNLEVIEFCERLAQRHPLY
jgi:hypothetical protein